MKKIIIILSILIYSFPLFSQEKMDKFVEYHFEYGFGLSEFTEFPKKVERGNVIPFPILDEYLVGLTIKKEKIEISPIIGIIESEKYNGRVRYEISSGVVIKRKNLRFKITNGGFSFVIDFYSRIYMVNAPCGKLLQ